jgi:ankyrin repeat protein
MASHASDCDLMRLMRAIDADDGDASVRLLAAAPTLARTCIATGARRQAENAYFLKRIRRHVYAGDTALHVAAAAYWKDFAQELFAVGADLRARNRRCAEPLHAAAVGSPGVDTWDPRAQAAMIRWLIGAGADPNAVDMDGVTPLHRAVRTRSAAAVEALLAGGADAGRNNGSGSTPLRLARLTTGRTGSGSPDAKAQQQEIVRLLERHGARR